MMKNTIERLADDFENEQGPFSEDIFPEKRLVAALGDEYKLGYLSAFCCWDYNRGVDALVENVKTVYEGEPRVFDPEQCLRIQLDELQSYFETVGFRYPNRDAKGWQDNCSIIVNNFGADWYNLLGAAQFSAPTLVKLLREEGFKYLKGKKLGPFYCRVINDHVHELDDLWKVDIPVDTWIRKLTQELLQKDMTDDEIREYWRKTGEKLDISPAIIDGGLWVMGYSWDSWGKEYFTELTGRDNFQYM